MSETTTIAIAKNTRDLLKEIGFKSETYDDIIRRLAELARKDAFFERQERIIRTEKFNPLGKL